MIEIDNPQNLFTSDEESELITLLNDGKVILFIGAGFSKDIENEKGNPIPLAGTLAERMNQNLKSNGETGFEGNNLYNLKLVSESFFNLNKESPKAIDNFFRAHLTVKRDTIPINYSNLKKVNWNGIYTTNYDDLLEAIYESENNGKIAFKKAAYKRNNSDLPLDNDFNIVYLNGDFNCNARLESSNNIIVTDLICSITDFSTNNVPKIWDYFIDKFRQYPIIIIGSQLNEEAFYNSLGSLINTTNFQGINRPKSYIINIDNHDQKFVELQTTYNLHHKVAQTEVFLDWLASKTELTNQKVESSTAKSLTTEKNSNNFIEFTKEYWENLKGKKSIGDLLKYYTNINSSLLLLPYVVADNFYVEPNEELSIKTLDESSVVNLNVLLPKNSGNHNRIIRINANGGTGKSTLLQHVGKKYCEEYHILYFKELDEGTPNLPQFSNDNIPIIVLLDNYGKQLERISTFSQALNSVYFERGFCLITTERHLRDSVLDSEIKNEINELFLDVVNCTINHTSTFYEKVFDKLISFIEKETYLSNKEKLKLRTSFSVKSKATTAERIIEFLISIRYTQHGFNFHFDWEDWEKLCEEEKTLAQYRNLYSIVAAFNNYDITPPIKFCVDLLGIHDPNLINTYSLFSEPKFDFPISIQKDRCFELRNPILAKWYIKEKDNLGLLTKKYFKDAIGNPISHEQMYVLRNAYRNHYILNDTNLKSLVPDSETLLNRFNQYISVNPSDTDNSKNKMETVIINLSSHKKGEAKTILYEMVSADKNDIHARTKLADILIRDKEYDEAKQIVDRLTQIAPNNNYILNLRIAILKHSADEICVIKELIEVLPKENTANLKYLYAKLAKQLRLLDNLIEAEEYCNKLIAINPSDYAAMNMLAMIYQEQSKFKEAEELLLKSINIQPYNPHNYNELGQVYLQLYENTNDIQYKYKAFDAFVKGLRVVKENRPLMTEFARFLMSYCNKFNFAESILKKNIKKDSKHFHSYTVLGKLYQKQYLFQKSKEVLEEGGRHIPNGIVKEEHIPMLVVLGNTYLELKEFDKAEDAFQKTIDVKKGNWSSHIGIAKAYLKQNKISNYEFQFNEILNRITDIFSLCDFANWLKGNGRIDDSEKVISKAKELNGKGKTIYINTIHAAILLEKIQKLNNSASLEVIKLNGQCEEICNETLKSNPNHEQTLHILYRLNLFFREKTPKENNYLRNSYSKKYKKYLGKLFLLNRTSVFVFEGVTQHLKTTRRYRLAIIFIKKYGIVNLNPFLYYGQLAIFWGFLENKEELKPLRKLAIENKFTLPDVKFSDKIELISQDNIGYLIKDKIKSNDKIYNIRNKPNINYTAIRLSTQSKEGAKVFFGLYKINGEVVADCIEPFFDLIPDDQTALKLLELD